MSLIPPVTRWLACGDYGNDVMAEPTEICRMVKLFFEPQV
jgi:phosphopantothenoylcysteine decarboxylase